MPDKLLFKIDNSRLTGNPESEGTFLVETSYVTIGSRVGNLLDKYRNNEKIPSQNGFADFLKKNGIEARVIVPDYEL